MNGSFGLALLKDRVELLDAPVITVQLGGSVVSASLTQIELVDDKIRSIQSCPASWESKQKNHRFHTYCLDDLPNGFYRLKSTANIAYLWIRQHQITGFTTNLDEAIKKEKQYQAGHPHEYSLCD